jgi:hypothetical protein
MSLETMISSLSRDEKLAAMELLWRDLTVDADSLASPEWHKGIIADRLDNPASGQALPLQKAKAEIKEAIHARRASS